RSRGGRRGLGAAGHQRGEQEYGGKSRVHGSSPLCIVCVAVGGYSSSSAAVSHNCSGLTASRDAPDGRQNTGRASRAANPSGCQPPPAAAAPSSTETDAWPPARALRSRVATSAEDGPATP